MHLTLPTDPPRFHGGSNQAASLLSAQDIPSSQTGLSKYWLQKMQGSFAIYSLETGAGPTDLMHQGATETDIHPVSPEVRPGQEVLAPPEWMTVTPDTRECFW